MNERGNVGVFPAARYLRWPGSGRRWAASSGIPAATAASAQTPAGSPGRPASCSAAGGAAWTTGGTPAAPRCGGDAERLAWRETPRPRGACWENKYVLQVASLDDGQRPRGPRCILGRKAAPEVGTLDQRVSIVRDQRPAGDGSVINRERNYGNR